MRSEKHSCMRRWRSILGAKAEYLRLQNLPLEGSKLMKIDANDGGVTAPNL